MSNIMKKDINEIQMGNMSEYYLSIMYGRAIGDVKDGLKPVHRRILYASQGVGAASNKPYKKSALIVGETLGKFHPHSNDAIYDASVRMTQDFTLNIPLLDGKGNMGNPITGDGAAAMRYTGSRLSAYSEMYLLEDLNKNAIDMTHTFDNVGLEPTVLPAKTLNLLINGSMGIGGGYAQHIPPHSVNSVCTSLIKIIDNPDISIEELAETLMPDFPTGGYLCSKKDIVEAYKTGRGNVRLRSNVEIKDEQTLVVKDIVYNTSVATPDNKIGLVKSITDAVKKGDVEGITSIQNLSGNDKVNIVIKLAKGYDAEIVLNQLYKYTKLQDTVKIILVCTNGSNFKEYNIKEIFTEWLDFRRTTIRRIANFDIQKYKKEEHEKIGLLKALDHIDDIINIIKNSSAREESHKKLVNKYKFTDMQVSVILDLRLTQLHKLEKDKLKDRLKELKDIIADRMEIMTKEERVNEIIKTDQENLMKSYGREDRTSLQEIDTNIDVEDMIKDEETFLVVFNNNNYIKRMNIDIRTQNRNTKGRSNQSGNIKELFKGNLKDNLLCFTNKGRVYTIKLYEIREGSMRSKGVNIENYIKLDKDEIPVSYLCIPDNDFDVDNEILMVTKGGYVKKTKLSEFKNIRKNGIIAISLNSEDELLATKLIKNNKEMQDVIIVASNGNVVRYDNKEIPSVKRDTKGVIGMKLEDGEILISTIIIHDEDDYLLFVTKKGLGKRVKIKDMKGKINQGFPRQKRTSNSKGRLGIRFNDGDSLVKTILTNEESDILVVSTENILSISAESIPVVKRPAMGSKLIDLKNDDEVVDINIK